MIILFLSGNVMFFLLLIANVSNNHFSLFDTTVS